MWVFANVTVYLLFLLSFLLLPFFYFSMGKQIAAQVHKYISIAMLVLPLVSLIFSIIHSSDLPYVETGKTHFYLIAALYVLSVVMPLGSLVVILRRKKKRLNKKHYFQCLKYTFLPFLLLGGTYMYQLLFLALGEGVLFNKEFSSFLSKVYSSVTLLSPPFLIFILISWLANKVRQKADG